MDDNGTGTDHGSGGVAFVISDGWVNGGHYGEYPSLMEDALLEGDLHFNNDFRSIYSTILDQAGSGPRGHYRRPLRAVRLCSQVSFY